MKFINLFLLFFLLSCGGAADFSEKLPANYKYIHEGSYCLNAITDQNDRIIYPWILDIKYDDNFIVFCQYYSKQCQEVANEYENSRDSSLKKDKKLYYILDTSNKNMYIRLFAYGCNISNNKPFKKFVSKISSI